MSLNVNFVPLSFITSDVEILKQIKNSVLISHLLEQCGETTLNCYLDSTQYGFTASASNSGTHKFLRITDINSGQVDWENVPYCNCENDAKYLLKENDILIARTGGTTGKSFCVTHPKIGP
jgi:type I restriction enzyme, S subunit